MANRITRIPILLWDTRKNGGKAVQFRKSQQFSVRVWRLRELFANLVYKRQGFGDSFIEFERYLPLDIDAPI